MIYTHVLHNGPLGVQKSGGHALMKISNSCYTAKNSRITGNENTETIAVTAIVTESNKEKKNIFQSVYTAQNRSITRIGLQYIQG